MNALTRCSLALLLATLTSAPSLLAQSKPKAVVAAATSATFESGDWTAVGAGLVTESPSGFAQEGSGPLVAHLSQQPASTSYVISGEAVLSAGSLQVFFTEPPLWAAKGKAPVKARAADAAPAETLSPLPPLTLVSEGKILKGGRTDEFPLTEAQQQALPVVITVTTQAVDVAVGPFQSHVARPAGLEVNLHLALLGGARLQNLHTTALPETSFQPLAGLAAIANTAVPSIAAGSLPKGAKTIDGIPFFFGESGRAVDVSTSMAGLADPFKNAEFYQDKNTASFGRSVITVSGEQYSALHLIAFSAGRETYAPRTTVRVGYYGNRANALEDIVAPVPALLEAGDGHATAVLLADGRAGYLHHVRVPLAKTANVKEFATYRLEFTRDLHTHINPPDPSSYGKIPVGLPSDVVILAATLEPSPVTLSYEAAEGGNVFYDTQPVQFQVTLTNRSERAQEVVAYASAVGPGTGEEKGIQRERQTVAQTVKLAPGASKTVSLAPLESEAIPVGGVQRRGWYECAIGIRQGETIWQQRDTTFAVLAPDTRKAMADSPFGVWEFWEAHNVRRNPKQTEILASLIHKGGWRWTYGGTPRPDKESGEETAALLQRLHDQYKITWNVQSFGKHSYQRGEGWFEEAEMPAEIASLQEKMAAGVDPYFKVLHESRSSTAIIRRYSEYLGGEPYQMPEAEKLKLEQQVENVKRYNLAVKKAVPAAKIVLINDYPAMANEYLARRFPADAFDVIGLEGAMFLRSPERQPDWMSLPGQILQMKRSMARHGYDKPIWTTEALYHPTEAGGLSLHEQGVIAVREAMLALQMGVQRMAAAGVIKDPADDYHWSNWGSAGFCFRDPEINPKPSYAMYAWMTQVLDQAKPNGKLAVPNPSVHVVDFLKPDGAHVYSAWVAKGVQQVELQYTGNPVLYDVFGNLIQRHGEKLMLTLSNTPQYITGAVLEAIVSAIPRELPRDAGRVLLEFDHPEQLKVSEQPNPVLDSAWETPRLKGQFVSSYVKEDGASALKISLQLDADPRKLLPRYVTYDLAVPIPLRGRPYEFTVRVKGNGGWGRVMFEVVDAKGRVFTSSGSQYSGGTNSADSLGESFVSFTGWHTMRFPVVGMYPGHDQTAGWPYNYNWWPTNTPEEQALGPGKPNLGQSPVSYPLKLTKLIVEMRPHILYIDEERPVVDPTIYLDQLGAVGSPTGE